MTPLEAVPSIPRDRDGPVFREPWEARAFAIVVALHEKGHFTWSEWAKVLGHEIAAATDDADGSRYYEHWLAALERIVAEKRIGAP